MKDLFQVTHVAWDMPAQNRYSHQTPASAVYWQWWIGKKTVWVAGLSEGTAFCSASSSTPSVHPNKPAQTRETNRAVDTNGQAHLATRVHWGPLWQPQSATWYSICQLPLLPLHCHRQRERGENRGEVGCSTRNQILISSVTGIALHSYRVIFTQSQNLT